MVLTAQRPRSKPPQQARLRKPPGRLRADACVGTGQPQPSSNDVERLLVFFFAPLVSLLNRQVFSQGSGPGAPHPHRAYARRLFFGYCSTVVPFFSLHRHSAHLTKARDRNLFYSECGRVTRDSARNLDSSPCVYSAGTREPGMLINGGLCMQSVRRTKGGQRSTCCTTYSARQSGR